jgi:hypothetical protein
LPVTRLNGVGIGTATVGPIFSRVLNAWSQAVGVDIPAQIKTWDAGRTTALGNAPTPYRFKAKTP